MGAPVQMSLDLTSDRSFGCLSPHSKGLGLSLRKLAFLGVPAPHYTLLSRRTQTQRIAANTAHWRSAASS